MKCSKCQLPGGAKNFHICMDLKAPLNLGKFMQSLLFEPKPPKGNITDEHRENLRQASQKRWAKYRLEKYGTTDVPASYP